MTNNNTVFDFDTIISRLGTRSSKWDNVESVFGSRDVLPLWVADMDFASPAAVVANLVERAKHPVYAYTIQQEPLYQAFIDWLKLRHNWDIEKDWIIPAPGVVPSIVQSILAISEPGEGVIIQPPVYPPFFGSVTDNGRILVENPLIVQNGRYTIDFDDLEQKLAAPQNKILLLCSPHNPAGRVWSREELAKVYELCHRYQVDVLSDEIHNDLVFQGHKHTVFASLSPEAALQTVTFMAASKTFNVAGLNFSFIIVPCERRRSLINDCFTKLHLTHNNLFGAIATETAYAEGQDWLDSLLLYLGGNADTLVDFAKTRLPGVKVIKPEGTYLAWLDFRSYFTNAKQLEEFLVYKARVGLNPGKNFGSQGEGFARLNFGTQRSVLLEGLTRIEKALQAIT